MKVTTMNKMGLLFSVLLVLSLGFATNLNTGTITNATNELARFICTTIPMIIFLAIVFAALLYGVAQMLPADQKARVMQFAGAAMVAAFLSALIYILAPSLMGILLPSNTNSFDCNNY
ncbi:MAG: hypothetical protein GXN92_01330 [Candidatus Micrarchaeota archaeon]|nr:hypothetical protein [Candidatus Micrarchaeota archaeon]